MEQTFISGALLMQNPTEELYTEATSIFKKDKHRFQILNIGSGLPPVTYIDQSGSIRGSSGPSSALPSDYRGLSVNLSKEVEAYLALNVIRGMENVKMDRWNELGAIHSHTDAYLATGEAQSKLEEFLRHLHKRSGTKTLEQIGMLLHIGPMTRVLVWPLTLNQCSISRRRWPKAATYLVP